MAVGVGLLTYVPFRVTPESTFWADLDPAFGTWHFPNARFRHRSSCFDNVYESNSYGARDVERTRDSLAARPVIVLGDSFAEGYGVARNERVTELLEASTGIEHLNFGTAGSFGSVQEWMQYRSLAKQFAHSDVAILILPDNDFSDNDPRGKSPRRYRPYLVPAEQGLQLHYTVSFEDRDRDTLGPKKILKNRLNNASYLFNVVRHISRGWKQQLRGSREATDRVSYDDYSEQDLQILLESYRRILVEMGAERRLWLYTVPRHREFTQSQSKGDVFRLPRDLESFANSDPRVFYHDLLPEMLAISEREQIPWTSLFLPCDGHWSPRGHSVAAQIIQAYAYPPVPR